MWVWVTDKEWRIKKSIGKYWKASKLGVRYQLTALKLNIAFQELRKRYKKDQLLIISNLGRAIERVKKSNFIRKSK